MTIKNIYKLGLILSLGLVLAGCQTTTTLVSQQNVVVLPSNALYNCPKPAYWPKTETLTDVEVAKLIRTLYANNVQCRNSLYAIRKFLNSANETVNRRNGQ